MKKNNTDSSAISTIIYTIKTMSQMDKPYVFLLMISMITMSALPFLNANLVSYIVNLTVEGYEENYIISRILVILAVIVILESVDAFVNWFRSNHYINLGHELDVIVARKTLSLRYEYAESPEVSELRMKANRAGSSLPVSAEATVELMANVIKTIGCATVFTMLNPIILVIVVAFTIVNYACSRHFQTKMYWNEQKEYPIQRKSEYYLSTMLDYVAGKDIRTFSASSLIKDKYSDAEKALYKVQNDTRRIRMLDQIIGLVVVVIQLTVIYFVTGQEYFSGRAQIGDAILYINLILVFSGSFQGIFYRLLDINYRGKRLQDFRDYLRLDEEDEKKEKVKIDATNVTIEFDHVWFRYPGTEDYILKDLSVCFDNQSKYAIVGENGSGKTTLIKLLMRFYLPTKGRILVNGVDYTTIDKKQYDELFTTVFQDYNLMAFTVAENIDFSVDKEVDRERIKEVLKRQGILESIEKQEKGIDTCISQEYVEDGVNFSGGERQKIAIARAEYKQAPVFVLDEPTSALDPIAEKKLYDSLTTMIKDKMMIIISHRLQSVMLCDKIVYLKKGEITEMGSHDELMKSGQDYSRMFELQAKWYK